MESLFLSSLQAGDAPLPADLANDIREYHSIQAYLVCKMYWNPTH